MTVQCKEIEYCKINVEYIAKPELVIEKRENALLALKQTKVKVPGFRKGKAPNEAYKVSYKKEIDAWVKRELVSEAYDETLFETKMKPIGYPTIHQSNLDGASFSCQMTFLKKPDFSLNQYKEFKIPKPHLESVSELTEKEMQNLRVQYGSVELYGEESFVQIGDQLTIDVSASLSDGSLIESLNQKGIVYTVGENTNELFDTNILGMKPDEERLFSIKFDDSSNLSEEVKNNDVLFNVKLHMGTKTTPCSLDNELAKKLKFETIEALQNAISGHITSLLQQKEQTAIQQQIIQHLISNHEFEVPAWLVSMESQKMAAANNLKWDEVSDEQADYYVNQAKQSVKLSLILDSVRDSEPEVVYSSEELIQHMVNTLQSQGKTKEESVKILDKSQKDGSLFGILSSLRDELTLKYIQEKSEIVS